MNIRHFPKFVVSRVNPNDVGTVVGTRRCQLEGCNGMGLIVRWNNGKRTIPCSKGLTEITPDTWKIS